MKIQLGLNDFCASAEDNSTRLSENDGTGMSDWSDVQPAAHPITSHNMQTDTEH